MKIREIALVAVFSAILFAGKEVLAFLPNVEIVTLFLIVIAACYKFRISISVCVIFSFLQLLIYGFNDWFFGYLIVFPIIVIIATLVSKKTTNELTFAIIAGIYGFLFDVPFAIIKGFLFGANYMVTYFVAGLLFDIVHGVANFIIVLFLFKPLYNLVNSHLKKFYNV
ncbi:MAG: hypothetical protein RR436_00080 [Clostridia bacterium]